MVQHSVYYSNFIQQNLSHIINDLKFGVDTFLEGKDRTNKNITYDYMSYNIFNLCANKKLIQHLKKIIFNYIRSYFDDFEIEYNRGILFNSWVNYHSSEDELLKLHGHSASFHGYVCIDPLDSTTVFVEPVSKIETLKIKNEVGLIYIGKNSQNSFHYVKMNSKMDRPRITVAFDFTNLNITSNYINNITSFSSVEVVFL